MDRSEILSIIRDRANAYGIDPATMIAMAGIETGGSYNPATANPRSSARGLYQFMTRPGGSWDEYGRGAYVNDPTANADAAARITKDNIAYFRSRLGRDPTPGETYLLHQQGRGGATALLSNPDVPVVEALRSVYRDPQRAAEAVRLNGGNPEMTAGQFASLWTSRMDREMGGGAAPALPPAQNVASAPVASVEPASQTGMLKGFDPPKAAIGALQRVAEANQAPDPQPLPQMQLGPTPYAQQLRSGLLSGMLNRGRA